EDGSGLTYVISPAYAGDGSVVNNGDGTFTFDPETDFQDLALDETTSVSFTYTATDTHSGVSNTGTVTVTVTGVNDPVEANNDTANVSKNSTVNIDVLGNDVDVDATDTLTVTLIDGQAVTNAGDFVTLTSGATVTLEADGSLTYDPNGIHPDLLPPDTEADSFVYTVSDGTVTDTATVNVTIHGSNEDLVVTDELEDISRDGLTPETIDLDLHFNDPDAGDIVTYSVEATLVGGGSLPANFWTNVISISGSNLNITYNEYASSQVRLPVEITVTAHSDDTLSDDVSSSFILTPDAQTTTEIRLIARPVASSGTDFTYFRASTTFDTVVLGAKGGAVFNLTNGQQDLNYTIGGLADFNNSDSGSGPIVDIEANLTAVRIIDTTNSGSTVFTIYHKTNTDDNPTVDFEEGLISGVWAHDDSTVFTSAILDQLYNGDLAVEVEIAGLGTQILSGNNIGVSPEVDNAVSLPSEQTEYYVGQDYVVEVWISDQLQQLLGNDANTGFSGALVSLTWAGAGNIPEALAANIMGEASVLSLNSGNAAINIDNDGNIIVEFNGGVTSLSAGVGGSYSRIGYAQFKAFDVTLDADPIEYSVDISQPDSLQKGGGSVHSSQINIVGSNVTQKQAYQFEVQTDQSHISVSGSVNSGGEISNLSSQDMDLNQTDLSGRMTVVLDDLVTPTSIQIADSYLEINPSGLVNPQRGATGNASNTSLADFGLTSTVFGGFGTYNLGLRDVIASMLSSQQSLNNGTFSVTDPWILENGKVDSITLNAFNDSVISQNTDTASGLELTFFDPGGTPPDGLSSWSEAELTDLGGGVFELVVPISRTLTFTDSTGAEITLNFTGAITSTFNTDQSDKHGDTTGTATDTNLTHNEPGTQVYQGVIGNNETLDDPLVDVDMFMVQLNNGDSVTVDVDGDMLFTGLDSVIYIFNEAGEIVAFSDTNLAPDEYLVTYGEGDSYVTFTADADGTYYIGVSALNGAYDDVSSYDPFDISSHDSEGNQQVGAFDGGGYDLTITVTPGVGDPLHGTQAVTNDQVLNEGTAFDIVVVRNQTEIDSTGHISGLPVSDTWIDEWSSFWVEIYVETADANSITDATVDLNYNTNFFTATEIEFSRAFSDNGTAIIDDTTGVVTGLSGSAALDRVGNYNKALLARVKFESLVQDDVTIDFEDKFIGPHALGLSLGNVKVGLTGDVETQIIVGDAPQTDLWAIAFDVNDDDKINYRDLIMLVSVYGQNVLDSNSPYVWALDSDKSGTVNHRDLTFLATNYGVHKGGDRQVVYPSNFLQRWYGRTTDITGESSIDQVMDEALGIWQDALGLEESLDIQLVITDLGGTQLGEGQITGVDEEGRPVSGIVTLDDNAAGLGWYSDLDSSAFSDTDLEGGVSYTADASSAAAGHYDLLTVLLHEIGHVLGFTDTYAPFESFIQTGVGGTLSFVGSGFEATLTDDGLHLDDTVHAGDVMNATLDPGVRKLPSILDTLILQSAHEAAAAGSFEILIGVNAPLMANLPLVAEPPVTQVTKNESSLVTVIAPLEELSPVVFDVTSSLLTGETPVQPGLTQFVNQLLQSQGLDQSELDLTVLEGLSDELINDLRLNGLSIVDGGKIDVSDLIDEESGDLDLAGLSNEIDADFDDVFSDWAGPIL
uniref:Ig-like domain-containing protein n=1 Tax=Gimesia sp. TaxID=2024833 RepID=UPI003A8E45A4